MKILSVVGLFLLSSLAWSAEDLRDIAKKCGGKYARNDPGLPEGKYFVMFDGGDSKEKFAICDSKESFSLDKDQSVDALWKLHAKEIYKFSDEKISNIDSHKNWGAISVEEPFKLDPEPVEMELLKGLNTNSDLGIYFDQRVNLIRNIQALPENSSSLFELGESDQLTNLSYSLLFKGIVAPAFMSSASELLDGFIESENKVEDGRQLLDGVKLVSPEKFFKMNQEEKKAILENLKLGLSGINYETCAWRAGAEPMIFGDKRENGCGQICSGTLDCQNFLKEPVSRVSVCSANKCQRADIKTAKGMMACTRDPEFKSAASAPGQVLDTRIRGAMLLSPKKVTTNCSGICVGYATGIALGLAGVNNRVVTCSPDNCEKSAKSCLADANFFSKEVNVTGLDGRRLKLDTLDEKQMHEICPGNASSGCQGTTLSE